MIFGALESWLCALSSGVLKIEIENFGTEL
jgi:hypothetical protein